MLEAHFLAAVYWSLGAVLIEESRTKFDSYMKKLSGLSEVSGEAGAGELPSQYPTLYEYYFDPEEHKWVPWSAKVPEYEHQPGMKFNEILVPTVDTVRNTWLLQLMVNIKHPVVLVGETGTSKTATTQNFLRNLDSDATVSNIITSFTSSIMYVSLSATPQHQLLPHEPCQWMCSVTSRLMLRRGQRTCLDLLQEDD